MTTINNHDGCVTWQCSHIMFKCVSFEAFWLNAMHQCILQWKWFAAQTSVASTRKSPLLLGMCVLRCSSCIYLNVTLSSNSFCTFDRECFGFSSLHLKACLGLRVRFVVLLMRKQYIARWIYTSRTYGRWIRWLWNSTFVNSIVTGAMLFGSMKKKRKYWRNSVSKELIKSLCRR